ncbi:MAG: hypothetical protein AB202_00365 [Parcubacteria bacterium C7867-007]|nr:MAG: hypothetical protein AB202_00365 [Parcubacteria bacterium C7867-007]
MEINRQDSENSHKDSYSFWPFVRERLFSICTALHAWGIGRSFDKVIVILTLAIALISLALSYQSVLLAREAVDLSTSPQINYYLQTEDLNSGEYTFGIENNGVISVRDLSVSYVTTDIYKRDCDIKRTQIVICGGSSAGMSNAVPSKKSKLQPGETFTFKLLTGTSPDMIVAVSVVTNYTRNVDGRRASDRVTYFIDNHSVYTLEAIRDIPSMQAYIAAFRQFSADSTLGNEKIYWQ